MSSRSAKRAKRGLEARLAAYKGQKGERKPGSLNPKRSSGGARSKKRRK